MRRRFSRNDPGLSQDMAAVGFTEDLNVKRFTTLTNIKMKNSTFDKLVFDCDGLAKTWPEWGEMSDKNKQSDWS